MLGKIFSDLSKTFVRISAVIVLTFIFASCSETVLNPEDNKDDPPVLGGWPEPITFFNTIGEGDLQLNITCKVDYYPSINYNVVQVHFTNSEDTYGGTITLSPNMPSAYNITFYIGQKKLVVENIGMIPAYLNEPGILYISGTYYSQRDGLPFRIEISWYADGSIKK